MSIIHPFDPDGPIAFYAGVAIERWIWRAVACANRPQGRLSPPEPLDPRQMAEENLWQAEVRSALAEAVSRLPRPLRQVIVAAYGLDGEPPRTLIAIGQWFGVSRESTLPPGNCAWGGRATLRPATPTKLDVE